MANQSEEAKLRRRGVKNRRGVFSTWGYPTWDAFLVRADEGADPADSIAASNGVGVVVRDVTAEVLGGTWQPPLGEWALLVTPKVTPWSHLVSRLRGDEIRERLGGDFRGGTLQTGFQDTAGVVYVRYYVGGVERLNFVTDGERWNPDPEEEDEGVTYLSGDVLGLDWLDGINSAPEAHQEVIRHFDAYVPGLAFDEGKLGAAGGHEDFVSVEHIKRIDLVRFGEIPTDEPGPEVTAAGRRLHEAVEKSDLAGVKAHWRPGRHSGFCRMVGHPRCGPHATTWVKAVPRRKRLWTCCSKPVPTQTSTRQVAVLDISCSTSSPTTVTDSTLRSG